jgi:hypothetical protein
MKRRGQCGASVLDSSWDRLRQGEVRRLPVIPEILTRQRPTTKSPYFTRPRDAHAQAASLSVIQASRPIRPPQKVSKCL